MLVVVTSGVFLANFPKMPEMGPEPSPTGEPAAAEPEEPNMEEADPEPEAPPMASEHFGFGNMPATAQATVTAGPRPWTKSF